MSKTSTPKRSRRAEMRTRQSVFVNWLSTSPHVTSYVEDREKGLSRTTRSNTVANRSNLLPGVVVETRLTQARIEASRKKASNVSQLEEPSSSSTITSLSDRETDAPRRNVAFAEHARVYPRDHSTAPSKERVRTTPRASTLEARRKRATQTTYLDPSMPMSAGGKWILGKSSSSKS